MPSSLSIVKSFACDEIYAALLIHKGGKNACLYPLLYV